MDKSVVNPPERAQIVAREGWIFIFIFLVLTVLLFGTGHWIVGIPMAGLMLFSIYFFRNPERICPKGENIFISPADGRIVEVSDVEDNPYTKGPAKKLSIFMSVFNVHVNRIPISGEIVDAKYYPGKFFVASENKASENNERNAIVIRTDNDVHIGVVQVAGLVARRIVCYLGLGDEAVQGKRLGLIRFGSRVDLYLPTSSKIDISVGDRVKAGLTILGSFK